MSVTSWRGPLARASDTCAVRPVTVAVVGGASASIDPIHAEATGEVAAGSLGVAVEGGLLRLDGTVPARPGSYETVLRVEAEGDRLDILVRIDVAASVCWGIGLMLLGLSTLGLLGALSGEGAIEGRLADALALQSGLHAALAAHPPSPGQIQEAARVDGLFGEAIGTLSEARPLSIVDPRAERAKAPLADAQAGARRLEAALSAEPVGAVDLTELESTWEATRAAFGAIGGPSGPGAEDRAGTLAFALDRYLVLDQQRFLIAPIGWVTSEMMSHLARARLDLIAGEGDLAQAEVATAATWLRRAVAQLARTMERHRLLLATAGTLADREQAMRQALQSPDLADGARAAVSAKLDCAIAALDPGAFPSGLLRASSAIDEADLMLTRAVLASEAARFDAAAKAGLAVTDMDDLERLAATVPSLPHDPATKQAFRLRFLALWQGHVASVADAKRRAALQRRIDAMAADLKAGRLGAFADGGLALSDEWSVWRRDLVGRRLAAAAAPACARVLADAERIRAASEARLRAAPSLDPTGEQDRALNRLLVTLRDATPDPDAKDASCLLQSNRAYEEATRISGAITQASLPTSGLAPAVEARLLAEIGKSAAAAVARPLAVRSPTVDSDRVVNGPVVLGIGNFATGWGRGFGVLIDWGDGTAPTRTDVEAVEQGRTIAHRYAKASAPTVLVTVVDGDADGASPVVGSGTLPLAIRQPPVTAAETLADMFINGRFALALLVSLTVYLWRYRSRNAVFGARGFDYVETFALGFAAYAATDALPEFVAKLVAV